VKFNQKLNISPDWPEVGLNKPNKTQIGENMVFKNWELYYIVLYIINKN